MTRRDIDDLLDRWLKAMDDHDLDALALLYAKDCVIESPLAAGKIQGREANANVHRAVFEAFPDLVFRREALLIDGDLVAQIGKMTGTDTGGLMGMTPSGRVAEIPIVFYSKVAGGEIVFERRVYDFTGLLVQVGVLKARPA